MTDSQPMNMLQQIQRMQQDVQAAQEELLDARVEATVGGGVVKATVTGNGERWLWDRCQNMLTGFSFCTRTNQKWTFDGSYDSIVPLHLQSTKALDSPKPRRTRAPNIHSTSGA